MIIKKQYFSLILLLIFVFLSACATQEQSNNSIKVFTTGELAEHFDTFDELVKGSEIIVEVTVTATETIVYGDIPFTISNAEIKQSLKGSYNEGDSIKVLETGGKFYPLDKNNNQSKEEHELVFEGIKVMNLSDTYIVFLDKYKGPITDDSFVINGTYQGKFNLKDNIVSQQNANGHLATSYSNPQSLEEFVKKVKEVDTTLYE